jgi:carbon monoxide dehydrogenase subunit G
MRFENEFVVQAPIDEVYAALLDVERVAPCMPGAEVSEKTGDDAYKVAIKVKVGPISMTYKGDVEIVERDDAARTATMRAKAKEARGQGTADAHVHMALSEEPDGTHGRIETDVQLSGRAAAMGRGVIADVSARLVDTFAANLATMLSGPAPEPAAASAAVATPPAEAAAPAPPETARRAPAQDSLPVGDIVGGVVADRLSRPGARLAAGGISAMLLLVIGYLIGRRR